MVNKWLHNIKLKNKIILLIIVPIKDILEERLGIPVSVEHDPDCLLYPHITYQSKENILLLRVDKSIGMAVAVDGKILRGKGLFEIAHMNVIPDGKMCYCGCHGCMEAYVNPCMTDNGFDDEKIKELMYPLAVAIKNMSVLFNSEKLILTGALLKKQELFYDKLLLVLKSMKCNIPIQFLELSDYAVQGAALMAVDKSIRSLFIE